MFVKRIFIVFMAIMASFIFACYLPYQSTFHNTYSDEDNGETVNLHINDIFEIALKGNPTTGYMWEIVELDEHILRQLGEPEFKPQSDAVGAPGVQTFCIEAVNAGQMVLKLIYNRSWEEDVAPLKTFSLQMEVHRPDRTTTGN